MFCFQQDSIIWIPFSFQSISFCVPQRKKVRQVWKEIAASKVHNELFDELQKSEHQYLELKVQLAISEKHC